jgi:hypothetical protein
MSRRRRRILGAGGGGIPSGAKLWLDASDTSTITDSSGSVSAWADKSGNGLTALQGSASSQPLTNTATINGRNGIWFDGSNDAMSVAATSAIDNIWSGGGTVIAMYVPTNNFGGRVLDKRGSTQAGWSIYHNDTVGDDARLLIQQDGAVSQYGYRSDDRGIMLSQPNIGVTTWDSDTPATTSTFYLNSATASTTDTFNTGSGAAVSDAARNLFIGNRNDLARGASLIMGEVILYDRILSTPEIAQIYSYLVNKWSAPFDVTGVTDLALWLDASDADTITEVGGAVSQWDDKSGNANHVTQGTGSAQPTTGATSLNGKNVIDFDGTDTLILPAALYSIANGNNTVFVVSKRNTETGSSQKIFSLSQSGSQRLLLDYSSVATFAFYQSRAGAGNGVAQAGINTNFEVFTAYREGTTQSITRNTSAESTNSNGQDENGIDAGHIGSVAGTSGFLVGSISEIIVCSSALSATERAQVRDYLINKWGI